MLMLLENQAKKQTPELCHWNIIIKGHLCTVLILTLRSHAKWNATKPEASCDNSMKQRQTKLICDRFQMLPLMEHYRTSLQLMSSLVHWHKLKWLSRVYLLRIKSSSLHTAWVNGLCAEEASKWWEGVEHWPLRISRCFHLPYTPLLWRFLIPQLKGNSLPNSTRHKTSTEKKEMYVST